jgi:hypothetical protein
MRKPERRTWIILATSLVLLLVQTYLPILYAWGKAESMVDVAHVPQFMVVKPNAAMDSFSVLYFPMMNFHARMCGYGFVGIDQGHLMYVRGFKGEPENNTDE